MAIKFISRPGAGRDAQRVTEKKFIAAESIMSKNTPECHHQHEISQVQNHAKPNNGLRIHTGKGILSKSNYRINATVGTGHGYDREEG